MSAWSPPGPCVRAAWLTLGAASVALDNPAGGWFCTSLDLGSIDVRAVTYPRPQGDGLADLTRFMGGRVVTAEITALVGAGARIDDVADNFAPFMVPSARPVLHYVLDRPGAAERTLTLRAAAYTWKIEGSDQRDIQLQWQAADPIARDPTTQTVTAFSGSSSGSGRLYNLSFPRMYPLGGGSAVNAMLSTPGDVAIMPMLRIYGPITQPQVWIALSGGGGFSVYFVAGFRIDQGHRVDVDCARHSALMDGDPSQSVLGSIAWNLLYGPGWPVIGPAPAWGSMSLSGQSTSASTQVSASWNDGYLT
jgi:hypothetical protein